jgi:hypothetical protein
MPTGAPTPAGHAGREHREPGRRHRNAVHGQPAVDTAPLGDLTHQGVRLPCRAATRLPAAVVPRGCRSRRTLDHPARRSRRCATHRAGAGRWRSSSMNSEPGRPALDCLAGGEQNPEPRWTRPRDRRGRTGEPRGRCRRSRLPRGRCRRSRPESPPHRRGRSRTVRPHHTALPHRRGSNARVRAPAAPPARTHHTAHTEHNAPTDHTAPTEHTAHPGQEDSDVNQAHA